MRTTIFVELFPSIFRENQRKCRISLKISSKIVPGFFIMVFCYILVVNFHFFGPGCGPPHKGTSNEHFVEEFAIGIKQLNFLEQTAGTQHSGSRK